MSLAIQAVWATEAASQMLRRSDEHSAALVSPVDSPVQLYSIAWTPYPRSGDEIGEVSTGDDLDC